MIKNNIGYIFFVAFIFLAIFIMFKLLYPFGMVIFFAVVFYVLLKPLFIKAMGKSYKKDTKAANLKKNALGLIFSLTSLIIFLVPTTILAYTIVIQMTEVANISIKFFKTINIDSIITNMRINEIIASLPFETSLEEIIKTIRSNMLSQLTFISKYLTQNLAGLLKGMGGFVSSFIFMMFTLFFFFVDGDYLINQLITLLPIEKKYANRLFHQTSEGIKGIIFGNLFTGIFQGILAFIVFSIFKVHGSVTFAFLIIIASFIPLVGTAIIWVPLGLIIMMHGEVTKGIIFLILSWGLITIPDNFIRPLLLGNRVALHPLFVFFSILGGVLAMGLPGIIMGPLVFILFFETMKMFNEEKISENKVKIKVKKYHRKFM